MKACVIIPARFKSSRFPGKPLAKILNKEMIIWVAALSAAAVGKTHVYVATDDLRISSKVNEYGFNEPPLIWDNPATPLTISRSFNILPWSFKAINPTGT